MQADNDAVLARLRRIEGQIRGLQRMVDEDAYCIDILTQISAASRALQGVALELLDAHLEHCVRDAKARELATARNMALETVVADATEPLPGQRTADVRPSRLSSLVLAACGLRVGWLAAHCGASGGYSCGRAVYLNAGLRHCTSSAGGTVNALV